MGTELPAAEAYVWRPLPTMGPALGHVRGQEGTAALSPTKATSIQCKCLSEEGAQGGGGAHQSLDCPGKTHLSSKVQLCLGSLCTRTRERLQVSRGLSRTFTLSSQQGGVCSTGRRSPGPQAPSLGPGCHGATLSALCRRQAQ